MKAIVQNKEALLDRLLTHQSHIKSFGVSRLGIFGSFAKDNSIHIGSDVDFYVEFENGKKTFDNFMDLSFYLEDLVGRKVELVTPQSLSKHSSSRIIDQVENVIC